VKRSSLPVRFFPDIKLSKSEEKSIAKIVKTSHAFRGLYPSLRGFFKSNSVKLCGLRAGAKLVSFAYYMNRRWVVQGKEYSGLSIGLVTTIKSCRGKGFATVLIKKLEKFAQKSKSDFFYLQGIKNFYNRMGFSGFAPKSKFIFETAEIKPSKLRVRSANFNDLTKMANLYKNYSTLIHSHTRRDTGLWKDLLGPLKETFLFYRPKVICNRKGSLLGYFCTSPENSDTIREFVTKKSAKAFAQCLSAIRSQPRFTRQKQIEIFSSFHQEISEYAQRNSGATFVLYLRPRSSNMVKILNPNLKMESLQKTFVLQGDNL